MADSFGNDRTIEKADRKNEVKNETHIKQGKQELNYGERQTQSSEIFFSFKLSAENIHLSIDLVDEEVSVISRFKGLLGSPPKKSSTFVNVDSGE